MVGISTDAPERNRAWAESLRLPFRLLSDLGPKGKVGRLYGVWDELWALERRATFLVDRQGMIRFVAVDSLALDGRGVLEALAQLRRASQ
ncbi:MAG: redoxin domain-containing protein [Candidatus Rokubacteria bacterium]|nr:redoxin domain-containing protein [Candidatus Rokubacteria bacterium]